MEQRYVCVYPQPRCCANCGNTDQKVYHKFTSKIKRGSISVAQAIHSIWFTEYGHIFTPEGASDPSTLGKVETLCNQCWVKLSMLYRLYSSFVDTQPEGSFLRNKILETTLTTKELIPEVLNRPSSASTRAPLSSEVSSGPSSEITAASSCSTNTDRNGRKKGKIARETTQEKLGSEKGSCRCHCQSSEKLSSNCSTGPIWFNKRKTPQIPLARVLRKACVTTRGRGVFINFVCVRLRAEMKAFASHSVLAQPMVADEDMDFWPIVQRDMKAHAPMILKALDAIAGMDKSRKCSKLDPRVGAAMCILGFTRSQRCSRFQKLVSMMLYTSKSMKETFALLNRLGISVSYSRAVDSLHTLGKDFDVEMLKLDKCAYIELTDDDSDPSGEDSNKKRLAADSPEEGANITMKSVSAGKHRETDRSKRKRMKSEPMTPVPIPPPRVPTPAPAPWLNKVFDVPEFVEQHMEQSLTV